MRLTYFSFFIIGAMAIFPVLQPIAKAEPPPITIKLNFHNASHKYDCSDKVGVTIEVDNTSSEKIFISNGFKSRRFYLNMRIIDPAGRLLIPKMGTGTSAKFPPPLPLGFVEDSNGKLVMAAPCEVFEGKKTIKAATSDLNDYYNFELSGYYSAQVQLSLMEFKKNGFCNPKNYRWLGVLKSKTQYFFVDGKLPIRIIPNRWQMGWKNGISGKVMVQIPLHDGRKPVNIDRDSIRLNKRTGTVEKVNNMLKAVFKGKDCIESLKDPHEGKSYRVWVFGSFSNGRPFCGSQKIIIIPYNKRL